MLHAVPSTHLLSTSSQGAPHCLAENHTQTHYPKARELPWRSCRRLRLINKLHHHIPYNQQLLPAHYHTLTKRNRSQVSKRSVPALATLAAVPLSQLEEIIEPAQIIHYGGQPSEVMYPSLLGPQFVEALVGAGALKEVVRTQVTCASM